MYTHLLHKAAVKARKAFKRYDQNYWKNIGSEYFDNIQSLLDSDDQLMYYDGLRTEIEKRIMDSILPLFKSEKFNVIAEDLYGWSRYNVNNHDNLLAYIRIICGVFNTTRKRYILPQHPTLSIVLAKSSEDGIYKFSDIIGALIMNYSSGDILLTEDDQTTILIEKATYVRDYIRTSPASLNPDEFLLLANLQDYRTRKLVAGIQEGLLSNDQWSIESFNSPEFEMACVLTGDADAYFNNNCVATELGAAYLMLKNSGGEILELAFRTNLYHEVWFNENVDDIELFSIVAAGTNQSASKLADMIDPPKKNKKK